MDVHVVQWHRVRGVKARHFGELKLDMRISSAIVQPHLEAQFPEAFKLMHATGTHPNIHSTPINPYTGENSGEWFGNIGDHAVVVGWCAHQLSRVLCARGVMTVEECRDTTLRALIHDVGKPFEIFRRNSQKDLVCAYHPQATADLLDRLLAHGYDVVTATQIVSAGGEVGHLSLALFIDRTKKTLTLRDRSYDSKIVFLSDALASGSITRVDGVTIQELLPSQSRIDSPRFKERYPWMFSAGLSKDFSGDLEYIWDASRATPTLGTFAQLQVYISRAIAQEFLYLSGRQGSLDPELGVISILHDSYRALQQGPVSVGF